jgi:predicted Rossmann fold flavoprotein
MSVQSSAPSVIVRGGGAAGFFAAIARAEQNPASRVILLERSSHTLAKVKISGGGRCNVTHACFDPALLATFYPRGGAALRGPFSRFQPRDTVAWFESRGVAIKTEADGRMFPVSNSSQTIIDCLNEAAARANVTIRLNSVVDALSRDPEGGFHLRLNVGEFLDADRIILATGSSPQGLEWARALGHTIEPPVPSLFTFTIKDPRLEGLSGLSVPQAALWIENTELRQNGPLLITHWGLSGPAVLKLSAWGARILHGLDYHAGLHVNWLPDRSREQLLDHLKQLRSAQSRKAAPGDNSFGLPRRLWARLASAAGIPDGQRWSEVSNDRLQQFALELQDGTFEITGKSTFKEEFVTCGGVCLDEVDFRTMQSKRCPHLYLAGEVLDIDGVTGGFNFQNAWTTGWLAGKAAAGD